MLALALGPTSQRCARTPAKFSCFLTAAPPIKTKGADEKSREFWEETPPSQTSHIPEAKLWCSNLRLRSLAGPAPSRCYLSRVFIIILIIITVERKKKCVSRNERSPDEKRSGVVKSRCRRSDQSGN